MNRRTDPAGTPSWLTHLCAINRPELAAPTRVDDWLFASNGHVAVLLSGLPVDGLAETQRSEPGADMAEGRHDASGANERPARVGRLRSRDVRAVQRHGVRGMFLVRRRTRVRVRHGL